MKTEGPRLTDSALFGLAKGSFAVTKTSCRGHLPVAQAA